MTQNRTENRQMTLAARPVGTPGAEHFALKTTPVPSIAEGQLLLSNAQLKGFAQGKLQLQGEILRLTPWLHKE